MSEHTPRRRRVGDRFRITEWAGSGGFANVWRATDEEGGPDVAVKFPRYDGSNDQSIVEDRFERAYRTLESFGDGVHPTSLVHFVDGRVRDPMYLVTEFVEGTDLSSATTTPGPQLLERYGLPIVRAVSFLHENGYLYLDLKPENVLVRTTHDRPVLIDFNTAESATETETLFHEDAYKAPEQLPDGRCDGPSGPWTDVYGLGKLLVYLTTGQTVKTAETPADGIDVGRHDQTVPAGLADIIAAATSAAPAARPQTATRLATALYEELGRDGSVATLTDGRNGVACPVRAGDTVGRVAEDDALPTVAVADPQRYVSPVQFELRHEDDWIVEDRSLNGTYLDTGSDWERLLSEDGYRRLQSEAGVDVPDEQPYTAARLRSRRILAPVDPSYSIQFQFDP